MSKLLIKPANNVGKIHDISPEKAGWGYVGFDLYLLEEGQSIKQAFDRRSSWFGRRARRNHSRW